MKKPYKHTDLSEQVCAAKKSCKKFIKMNVLKRKTKTGRLTCFKHSPAGMFKAERKRARKNAALQPATVKAQAAPTPLKRTRY